MGKGDSYRPVDIEKYTRNWDRIFGGGTDEEQRAPWSDDACDEELARDDNFCLDCMGHVCTCEEDENVC